MQTQCPECRVATKVPDKYLEKMAKCQKCQHIFIVKAFTPPAILKSQQTITTPTRNEPKCDIPKYDEVTERCVLCTKCTVCMAANAFRLTQEQSGKEKNGHAKETIKKGSIFQQH